MTDSFDDTDVHSYVLARDPYLSKASQKGAIPKEILTYLQDKAQKFENSFVGQSLFWLKVERVRNSKSESEEESMNASDGDKDNNVWTRTEKCTMMSGATCLVKISTTASMHGTGRVLTLTCLSKSPPPKLSDELLEKVKSLFSYLEMKITNGGLSAGKYNPYEPHYSITDRVLRVNDIPSFAESLKLLDQFFETHDMLACSKATQVILKDLRKMGETMRMCFEEPVRSSIEDRVASNYMLDSAEDRWK